MLRLLVSATWQSLFASGRKEEEEEEVPAPRGATVKKGALKLPRGGDNDLPRQGGEQSPDGPAGVEDSQDDEDSLDGFAGYMALDFSGFQCLSFASFFGRAECDFCAGRASPLLVF